MRQKFSDAIAELHELGFRKVFVRKFIGRDGAEETLAYFWRAGLLVKIESFNADEVRQPSVFFNLRCQDGASIPPGAGSLLRKGSEVTWVGSSIFNPDRLAAISEAGEILQHWIQAPRIYLCDHTQKSEENRMLDLPNFPVWLQKNLTAGSR